MERWRVTRISGPFDGPGPNGAEVQSGVNVFIEEGSDGRKITVWYVDNASKSDVRPRDAVHAYLDDDAPPKHVVVAASGVTVLAAK